MAECLRDTEMAVSTLPAKDKDGECMAGKRFKLFIESKSSQKETKQNKTKETTRNCISCIRLPICCLGSEKGPAHSRISKIFFFFLKMYQNILAYQLLKLPNSASSSEAKSPLSVANSSAPLRLWEEFRIGRRERVLASFLSARYRAGWHTRGSRTVQGGRSGSVAVQVKQSDRALPVAFSTFSVSKDCRGHGEE